MNLLPEKINLFLLVFSTLFMTGLIWFVQVVHYPLFGKVGQEVFSYYENVHKTLTTAIVAPVMLIELATSIALLFLLGPFQKSFIVGNLVLLAVIWLSTAFIQVPLHGKLSGGFDLIQHQRLVDTNWIRTISWTIRSIWLLGVLTLK
jgi:fatty acid desaturase